MGERLSPIGQFYGHHPNSKAWPKCGQNVKISSPHVPSALQSSLKGMAVLQHSCHQRGRRRWSPLGGFNPPPTVGVQGVLDYNCMVCLVCQVLSAKFSIYAQYAQAQISYTPLLFSPGGSRPPQPLRHLCAFCALGAFFCDFLPLRNALQKLLRKNCENRGFWPPKTLPKPSQNASKNDVPKNIDFCEVFYHSFGMFVIFETLKISIFSRGN